MMGGRLFLLSRMRVENALYNNNEDGSENSKCRDSNENYQLTTSGAT